MFVPDSGVAVDSEDQTISEAMVCCFHIIQVYLLVFPNRIFALIPSVHLIFERQFTVSKNVSIPSKKLNKQFTSPPLDVYERSVHFPHPD